MDGCQCRFSVQTLNVVPHFYDGRNPFRVRALLRVRTQLTVFYTELSTVICPDVAWKRVANSYDKSRGSSNRSGHKRLVFRVTADVFLHKRANRNDSQVVLARIFQCSMS